MKTEATPYKTLYPGEVYTGMAEAVVLVYVRPAAVIVRQHGGELELYQRPYFDLMYRRVYE
jgi:hypothetical protein